MLFVLKSWTLQSELELCSCVALGQLLHLSEPWLLHLETGRDHHCTGECMLKELTKPSAGKSVLWGRASQLPHCPPQWPGQSLLSGTLLLVVGYLAADLSSPHQRSVAPFLHVTTRSVSRHPGTSAGWDWRVTLSLGESHACRCCWLCYCQDHQPGSSRAVFIPAVRHPPVGLIPGLGHEQGCPESAEVQA